jgi:N-acetyl-alpha-D-glucosaminyl L-malate synthase BshA
VGGSGILATRLGIEFARRRNNVHFITYERPVAIQGIDVENVTVHLVSVIEYPLFKYPPYTIALGSEMARVSEKSNLDVLHVHYSIPHAAAAYLARGISGTPFVVTLHGSDVTLLGSDPAYMPANNYSIETADAVTAVSRFMANEAEQRLGIRKEIKVIPNFVDEEKFSPVRVELSKNRSNRDIIITHVSNFRPVKRIQDLVYSMSIVSKEIPGARLMLVGDGPERHRIERLVNDLNLNKTVLITGFRSDIPNIFQCSDLAVLSSETESAPLTLLEAMSCGLPVVSTRVGGIPEIIKEGFNGFLVDIKHPEAIAEKIIQLNNNPDLRMKMGKNARKTILDNFTASIVLQDYMEVYEGIL